MTHMPLYALIQLMGTRKKGIVIGKGGSALKKVGTRARGRMEKFFAKKVYLETRVKVRPSWRSSESSIPTARTPRARRSSAQAARPERAR